MENHSNALTTTNGQPLPPFVIGIDLGTTNSLLAVAGRRTSQRAFPTIYKELPPEGSFQNFIPVELLQLSQENLDGTVASHIILFPSVVFQDVPENPPVAGMGAKETKYTHRRGKNVFYSVKMDLGTDHEPYYPGAVSDQLNTPLKVSAVILRTMREAAERQVGLFSNRHPGRHHHPASVDYRKGGILHLQQAGLM